MITLFQRAVFAIAAVMASTTLSANAEELGPAIGQAIPHQLSTEASPGTFDELKGENGMVLFFVRSLDWCPFCKGQAKDVSERLSDFETRGLSVAFVSYDGPEKQRAFADRHAFKPTLISDQAIEVIDAFELRNEQHAEGSRFYGIPHPAVFVIDDSGVVRAKFYEEDFATNKKSYRNRPEVDVILDGVDASLDG